MRIVSHDERMGPGGQANPLDFNLTLTHNERIPLVEFIEAY